MGEKSVERFTLHPSCDETGAGDEQGLITSNFCNPNLDDCFFCPPNTPVRHQPSLVGTAVKAKVTVLEYSSRIGPYRDRCQCGASQEYHLRGKF